ncbi:hypothetical protein IAT38_006445 [Cryptococcus sp. DSM 104549]
MPNPHPDPPTPSTIDVITSLDHPPLPDDIREYIYKALILPTTIQSPQLGNVINVDWDTYIATLPSLYRHVTLTSNNCTEFFFGFGWEFAEYHAFDKDADKWLPVGHFNMQKRIQAAQAKDLRNIKHPLGRKIRILGTVERLTIADGPALYAICHAGELLKRLKPRYPIRTDPDPEDTDYDPGEEEEEEDAEDDDDGGGDGDGEEDAAAGHRADSADAVSRAADDSSDEDSEDAASRDAEFEAELLERGRKPPVPDEVMEMVRTGDLLEPRPFASVKWVVIKIPAYDVMSEDEAFRFCGWPIVNQDFGLCIHVSQVSPHDSYKLICSLTRAFTGTLVFHDVHLLDVPVGMVCSSHLICYLMAEEKFDPETGLPWEDDGPMLHDESFQTIMSRFFDHAEDVHEEVFTVRSFRFYNVAFGSDYHALLDKAFETEEGRRLWEEWTEGGGEIFTFGPEEAEPCAGCGKTV